MPEVEDGDVLVRVLAVGICAGDAKCFAGAPYFWGKTCFFFCIAADIVYFSLLKIFSVWLLYYCKDLPPISSTFNPNIYSLA